MLTDAIARVRRRPWLVGFLAALNLTFALLATQPVSAALAPLDARPAGAAIVKGDDGLFAELLTDHPEIAREAAASGRTALIVYGLLAWLLAGGLLAQLGRDEDAPAGARSFLGAVGANAAPMLKVGALGLLLRLVPIAVAIGGWFAVRPFWHGHGFGRLTLAMALLVALFGLAWSLATIAIDYARALKLADPSLKSWRAVVRGTRLLVHRPGATLMLVAFSSLGFLLLTAVDHGLGVLLPTAPAWSALLLFIVRIAIAFGRAFVTTTALVGAALTAAPPAPPAPTQTGAALPH
jgi:GNAT superfamily N-acetyltransferase